MVLTDQGNVAEQLDMESQPPARRPRRTRILIGSAIALVLALGGGGGAYASWDSREQQALEAARTSLKEAEAAATSAWAAGWNVHAESDGKVSDDAVRVLLWHLLSASRS
ncbi:MAG: hypothetical protein AAGC63_15030, partial [Propionicimonas sp.]